MFISKNQVTFPGQDDESLPANLAENSPDFVVTILNKGTNLDHDIFTPKLIASWLNDLINSRTIDPINGEPIINYSLLGKGVINVDRLTSSELHLKLLELVEQKKILQLTPQYVIDLAVLITNYKEITFVAVNGKIVISKSKVVERFCQLLFVSFESGIVAKFTNSLKKKMKNLFPNHDLMSDTNSNVTLFF